MLGFARLSPQSEIAEEPLYELPLRVASLVRVSKLVPSALPEIVELERPALSRVPVRVGVNVSAPAVGTIVIP